MPNENVDPSILLPILRKIPLFANLDPQLHHEIIEHIVLMYYPEKYTIFNKGDEGDALYILKTGEVEVFEPSQGDMPVKKIADLSDGGFFGEMALVSEVPRNASVKTVTECEIFILNKDDFKQLLSTNTELAEQISAAVVDRLNENNRQV